MESETMTDLHTIFSEKFETATAGTCNEQRRIGSELKFPLVNPDGSAAPRDKVDALWTYLCDHGWQPMIDALTGRAVGAKIKGRQNDTLASCETGYCKTEFSMAHVGNLHELNEDVTDLRKLLQPFCESNEVLLLGYGIHPVTPPGKQLLMKKGRAGVWDKIFPSNRHIAPEDGDDVHLFTINAASHVHVSVTTQEAIPAVNVLNGFSAAQIALTANSNIWKGRLDNTHRCVSEQFWDLWMADEDRVGMPQTPFRNLKDYIETIALFKPVFVIREGVPVVLPHHRTFYDYYNDPEPVGQDMQGNDVPLRPEYGDFDLHCTCYWYNARISRYFTVENRVNDQQPPDELLCIPALTLGLVSALTEGEKVIATYNWKNLQQARVAAYCQGLADTSDAAVDLRIFAGTMLDLATLGLERRGLGEELYLEPLKQRLEQNMCPADEVCQCYIEAGIPGIVERCRL
jgi:gamma-glutamylcysteine synthetase